MGWGVRIRMIKIEEESGCRGRVVIYYKTVGAFDRSIT